MDLAVAAAFPAFAIAAVVRAYGDYPAAALAIPADDAFALPLDPTRQPIVLDAQRVRDAVMAVRHAVVLVSAFDSASDQLFLFVSRLDPGVIRTIKALYDEATPGVPQALRHEQQASELWAIEFDELSERLSAVRRHAARPDGNGGGASFSP